MAGFTGRFPSLPGSRKHSRCRDRRAQAHTALKSEERSQRGGAGPREVARRLEREPQAAGGWALGPASQPLAPVTPRTAFCWRPASAARSEGKGPGRV